MVVSGSPLCGYKIKNSSTNVLTNLNRKPQKTTQDLYGIDLRQIRKINLFCTSSIDQ